MATQYWNRMNRMPVTFRKKTNETNLKFFVALHTVERDKKIKHTREEVAELLKDPHCLFYYIKPKYYYGTLNGTNIMDYGIAKGLYKRVLLDASLEYANMLITVWFDEEWRMLKDVYKQL